MKSATDMVCACFFDLGAAGGGRSASRSTPYVALGGTGQARLSTSQDQERRGRIRGRLTHDCGTAGNARAAMRRSRVGEIEEPEPVDSGPGSKSRVRLGRRGLSVGRRPNSEYFSFGRSRRWQNGWLCVCVFLVPLVLVPLWGVGSWSGRVEAGRILSISRPVWSVEKFGL